MKSKKRNLYLGIVVVILIIVTVTYYMNRVKMNPAGTVGNTAGNLNNGGLFCEYDGTVYFSNMEDNGALYSMNPNETDVRKLNNLQVRNILAAGDYLYYFQKGSAEDSKLNNTISTKSFNRCSLNGKNVLGMTRDVVISAQLVDNYIYMLTTTNDGPVFSKMKIDKSDSQILANYEINPACAENGVIYYTDTEDNRSLHSWNTASDSSSQIWDSDLWNPILYGDYVYYMDVAENYRLCRYSLSQNVIEVLTNDRVDCYNIGSGYIYYQKNGDTPQLKCMRIDGSEVLVIAEGNYTNINMTSQYVYFQDFANENLYYHSYIGSAGFTPFNPE